MSTLSTTTNASFHSVQGQRNLPLSGGSEQSPGWLGLSVVAWVKIAVISLLLIALYRFNLARLWAKTNPFTGQGNWEHAIVIPIIGLYYLYIWRDQLLDRSTVLQETPRWTLPGVWALILAVPILLVASIAPAMLASEFGGIDTARQFLASLSDGGFSRLIPLALGVTLFAAAVAGLVYVKRQDIQFPSGQRWLNNVWHGLGAWLMAMCVLWGVGFFLLVLLPSGSASLLHAISYGISAVAIGGLAHIAFWGKSETWRSRYDTILGGSSAWFGAFVMLWGILFSFWGIYPGQNDFFKDVGMVVSLFGIVTLVAGWRVMKTAWFPIVFLFCALPWPDQVYSWVALPLQNFAAKIGVFTLQATGVEANQFGTKIVMVDSNGGIRTLQVAEACAGLKALMTFISVATAVAFLSVRPLWQKLLICASAIPIAIICNASRVAGQGLLDRYVSHEWSENFAHAFAGLLMQIPGFFMLLVVCWLIDHLFIEEADEKPVIRRGQGPAVATVGAAPAIAAPAMTATVQTPAVAAKTAVTKDRKVIAIPKKPATPTTTTAKPAVAPATAPAAGTAVPTAPAQASPAAAPRPAIKPAAATAAPVRQVQKPVANPATASVASSKPAVAAPAAKPAVAKPVIVNSATMPSASAPKVVTAPKPKSSQPAPSNQESHP